MKNIFIGGAAKSGKSRLAKYLRDKSNYNHIPLDYFTSSFKHNFPELGITSNVLIDENSSKLLSLFLSRVIEIIELKEDEHFILDCAHVYPEDIIKYLDPNKWDIYFLGYPNTTGEDKLEEIRKYKKGGWISNKSEYELKNTFSELVSISKNINEQCKIYNINFVDTSNIDVLNLFK